MTQLSSQDVSAGDAIPPKYAVIQVHVTDLKQLFNSIDPSPFRNRDLDPEAEEFIVAWAKDFGREARLALLVKLDRPAGSSDEAPMLREAIHEFFRQRAHEQRLRLRELFRVGRINLAIGLIALASAVMISNFVAKFFTVKGNDIGFGFGDFLRESLFVCGWVAMWRPLEIFLYDWWPIRKEVRLSDRLAEMPVRIQYANVPAPEPS
jgi:hypothetical protein